MVKTRSRLNKRKFKTPVQVFENRLSALIALIVLTFLILPLIVLCRYFTVYFSREAIVTVCLLIIALFILTTIISGSELSRGIRPFFSSPKTPNKYSPIAAGCFFSILYSLYITSKACIRLISPDFTLLSVCILSLISIFIDTLIGKKITEEYLINKSGANSSLSDGFSAFYCPYTLIICAVVFTSSLLSNSNIELAVLYTLRTASLTPLFFISFENFSLYIALKKANNMGISFESRSAFYKISGFIPNIDIIPDSSGNMTDFSFNGIKVLICGDVIRDKRDKYDLVIRDCNNLKNAILISKSAVRTIKVNFAISAFSYIFAVMVRLFAASEIITLFCIFLFIFAFSFNQLILKKRLDIIKNG